MLDANQFANMTLPEHHAAMLNMAEDLKAEISTKKEVEMTSSNGMDGLGPMLMSMATKGNSNDGGMFGGGGGGGLIGGLILGSLLRNGNGGLFGGNDGNGAGVAGAVLRSPPEQVQANMDLMAGIGAVDKAVAVSTATMEASQAAQSAGIVSQLNNVTASLATRIDGTKETVNAMAMVLSQQINAISQTTMENRYVISQNITADGDRTRSLITSQNDAMLNRQLSDANAQIIELRNESRLQDRTRGIEVNMTNNQNQLQQQQQQQQQMANLFGLMSDTLQSIRATNQAINIGAGTLTANPTNTNTNTRVN